MREKTARKRLELAGTPIAPGVVLGQAHLLRQISLDALEKNIFPVSDTSAEVQRLERAFAQTRSQLEQLRSQVRAGNGKDLANILEAQMALEPGLPGLGHDPLHTSPPAGPVGDVDPVERGPVRPVRDAALGPNLSE